MNMSAAAKWGTLKMEHVSMSNLLHRTDSLQTALRALASIWIALISLPATAQDHPNPTVQSIIDWHRQYCYENLADLRDEDRVPLESDFGIDEGSIYDIEVAEDRTATVVYRSFTCEGEGRGWCGSGGCGYFIVLGDRIFEGQSGYKPRVVNVPVYDGTIPAIIAPRHGTACTGAAGERISGVHTCFTMATWSDHYETFQSIQQLMSEVRLEEDEWVEVVRNSVQ